MSVSVSCNEQSSIRLEGSRLIRFDPFRLPDVPHDADLILITHSHFDHFSPEDCQKASKGNTLYVCPETMRAEAIGKGIPENRLTVMKPGEKLTLCGVSVTAIPSYNIGKPMHPKKNGWLGYLVVLDGESFYVCGDMDPTPEGRAVICDTVLLPIGGTYTMNAREAADFVNGMQVKRAIPTHYGTVVGSPKDCETFRKYVRADICVEIVL